jgi:glycosyltransferase involved in cell wall biosynthesis
MHEVSLAVLDTGQKVPKSLAARCNILMASDRAVVGDDPARNRVAHWPRIFAAAYGDGTSLLMDAERNCVSRAEGTTGERRGVARRLAHLLYAWYMLVLVEIRVFFFGLRPARGSERFAFYRALIGAIVAAHRKQPFTHVWVEHSYLIPEAFDLARRLGGLPLIIDAHNVESVLHERLGTLMKSGTARLWYWTQARHLRRIEAEGFRRSDLVLCCSDEDARFIRDLAPDVRVTVIPNGVDTHYMRPVGPEAPDPTVVFVGSFGYFPNVDAVEYFHAEVLPLIWREVPRCRFSIVGYGAECFASLAEQDRRIQVAANVPDVRPYLSAAWVFVVPLRSGSGTRLKILDAMAMGKPVVSTPVGSEGIDLDARGAGIDCTSAQAFAKKTTMLLRDQDQRRVMGQRGRQLAEDVFSWAIATRGVAERCGSLKETVPCKA